MSHDMQAAWAVTEIAHLISQNQQRFFSNIASSGQWSIYASQEGNKHWPLADGVISADHISNSVQMAFEFKRKNEGLHGVLTAIGQSLAYLEKGYAASIMAIPEAYDSHPAPGQHAKQIIDKTNPNAPILVYTYNEPDASKLAPFRGKLKCVRNIQLSQDQIQARTTIQSRTNTLWAHVREGSSDPDAYFKYCQTAKYLSCTNMSNVFYYPILPPALVRAILNINPTADPYKFLSNCTGNSLQERTWREFWFHYIVHDNAIAIWKNNNGTYLVNSEPSRIIKSDSSGCKLFFAGRTDSIKNKLVGKLNLGAITEDKAWEIYAQKVKDRAHSYREDIDSGLAGIGFLENDGRLTNLGYKFVDACERTNDPNNGIPKAILGAALLQNGKLNAFLFYIHKLSEEKFSADPFAFSTHVNSQWLFNADLYRDWLREKFQKKLLIYRGVSSRGGQTRKPFQGELAILRNYGYVKRFRLGIGLEINWPTLQESIDFFNRL